MRWKYRSALASALLAFGSAASAEPPGTERLEQAVADYNRAMNTEERNLRLEMFRRSARLFAHVIEAGADNADIYTNLGNASLQGERIGHAVLAYRRALIADPDHARALQNLQHARSLMPSWVPRPQGGGLLDSFFFWHRTLSRDERNLAAASCFALAALLMAASIRFSSATPRNLAILPVLAWLALMASILLDPGRVNEAVITADEAVARAADSTFAPSLLQAPLPGGTEVRVLERRSPWLRIRLANGRDVWIAESSVAPVSPPDEVEISEKPETR